MAVMFPIAPPTDCIAGIVVRFKLSAYPKTIGNRGQRQSG
jgi:hypothetical protein